MFLLMYFPNFKSMLLKTSMSSDYLIEFSFFMIFLSQILMIFFFVPKNLKEKCKEKKIERKKLKKKKLKLIILKYINFYLIFIIFNFLLYFCGEIKYKKTIFLIILFYFLCVFR